MSNLSASVTASAVARFAQQAYGKTETPAPARSANREQDLARQLDERLTEKLSRIRQQITPSGNAAGGNGGNLGKRVDILA